MAAGEQQVIVIDYSALEYLKLAIFYASWLYFPAAAALILVLMKQSGQARAFAAVALGVLSVLAYARFVEPRLLTKRIHDIKLERCFPQAGAVRLALFSDTHIGLFANAMPPARIAKAIAAAKPDAVLIAGDFTYFLKPEAFERTFAPFAAVGAPVFAVLGNHDVGLPGPDVGAPLTQSLENIGISVIDNRAAKIASVEIAGLSDSWQRRQDMRVVAAPSARPRLVLTHNPETVFDLPADAQVDLLLAGHTHGGQIYIPFVTCALLKIACNPVRYGLADIAGRKVFVTSGTGMVGLPMRFMVPPRIDILHVTYDACE